MLLSGYPGVQMVPRVLLGGCYGTQVLLSISGQWADHPRVQNLNTTECVWAYLDGEKLEDCRVEACLSEEQRGSLLRGAEAGMTVGTLNTG